VKPRGDALRTKTHPQGVYKRARTHTNATLFLEVERVAGVHILKYIINEIYTYICTNTSTKYIVCRFAPDVFCARVPPLYQQMENRTYNATSEYYIM